MYHRRGEFQEDILEINHDQRIFRYGIPQQHMMPVENILGTMQVREGEQGGSIVDWHWAFDVADENEEQAQGMLIHAGEIGINGINTFVQNQLAKAK